MSVNNDGNPFFNVAITESDGTPLVAAASTSVVAAFEPTEGAWETPAIANQPKVFSTTGRCLQIAVTDADSSMTSVHFECDAVDVHGRAFRISSTNASPGTTVINITSRAAFTISNVRTHVDGTVDAGVDTIAIRCSDVLGTPYDIAAAADISTNGAARVDNAIEGAPTLSTTNQTWTPATAPNGTRVFALSGRSTA